MLTTLGGSGREAKRDQWQKKKKKKGKSYNILLRTHPTGVFHLYDFKKKNDIRIRHCWCLFSREYSSCAVILFTYTLTQSSLMFGIMAFSHQGKS